MQIDEGQYQSSWDRFSVNDTAAVTMDAIAADTEFVAKLMKAWLLCDQFAEQHSRLAHTLTPSQQAVNGRPRNPTELRETDDVGFVMVRMLSDNFVADDLMLTQNTFNADPQQ